MAAPRASIFGFVWLALVACGGEALPIVTGCEPEAGFEPICGFVNPEDLVLLPDDTTLLISEFGRMDDAHPGAIVSFGVDSRAIRSLFPRGGRGSDETVPLPDDVWGDPECPAPDAARFAAHGIDLSRRQDGALQLLVVNHGGREAVELFEVSGGREGWELEWRGCAIPPEGAWLNDVVALPEGGFLVTHMMPLGSSWLPMLKAALGFDTGFVYAWSPGSGWSEVEGTGAAMPNGIQLSADGGTIFLNAYLGSEVLRVDRASGRVEARVPVSHPDNLNWSADGARLLVASHRDIFPYLRPCQEIVEGACPMPFAIVSLDPKTLDASELLAHEGAPMGAATAAVEVGDALFLGSFAGDRIVRVEHVLAQ